MWKENDQIINEMIKGSSGELWGHRLEQADHFPILNHFLDLSNSQMLLDLGCGAGDVSRIWKKEYLGIDLPWVIEKVAKICNSNANYLKIDVLKEGINSLPSSDCLLMNAFLDVQEEPLSLLRDICVSRKYKNIIVHRQQLIAKSNLKEKRYGKGYGNSTVPVSYISWEDLSELKIEYQIEPIVKWAGDYHSFLMRLK